MNKQENNITPEVKQALVSVSLLSAFIQGFSEEMSEGPTKSSVFA